MRKLFKKDELERYRNQLVKHRQVIAGDVTHLEDNALRNQRGNAATHDISNFADLGSDYHEQELSIGIIENSEDALRAIDAALAKIEEGTYGYCEGVDGEDEPHPIAKKRLKAIPWARLCIECQRQAEEEAEEL